MRHARNVLLGVLAAAAALALPSGAALAGTFSISPLRIDLSSTASTAALTVRNDEAHEVVVQAEALLWTQDAGQDQLSPSHDLIVSPTVFTLPPNGTQLVRVALRRDVDRQRELSYRLALQEVPQQARPDFNGLTVALRLSLPVFVAPQAAAAPALEWSLRRDSDGLVVVAANNGQAHARILNFSLAPVGNAWSFDQATAAYVLPGQARHWTVQLAQDQNKAHEGVTAADAALYRLKGTTDQGEFAAELPVPR